MLADKPFILIGGNPRQSAASDFFTTSEPWENIRPVCEPRQGRKIVAHGVSRGKARQCGFYLSSPGRGDRGPSSIDNARIIFHTVPLQERDNLFPIRHEKGVRQKMDVSVRHFCRPSRGSPRILCLYPMAGSPWATFYRRYAARVILLPTDLPPRRGSLKRSVSFNAA